MNPTPSHPRRTFLRTAGILMALPMLETILPLGSNHRGAFAVETPKNSQGARNLVCIGNLLGFYMPSFSPTKTGNDYQFPITTKSLSPHRSDLTVFSGLDHGVKGGHFAIHSFLSGVLSANAKGMPDGNITLDQRAAESIKGATRFPCLNIGSESGIHGGCLLSWTRSGNRAAPITKGSDLYARLFLSDGESEKAKAAVADHLRLEGSILDMVTDEAKGLSKSISTTDRQKLDEYFTSVREVEQQLTLNAQWSKIPKPKTEMKPPQSSNLVDDIPTLYDLIILALVTGSTRIATLEIGGDFNPPDLDVKGNWHALSHHGQQPSSIAALEIIDRYQVEQFARFLDRLKNTKVGDSTLFNQTMVLFGSGMGNANNHTNSNLPIIVAGGELKHGQHRAYNQGKEQKSTDRVPLCNLYLTLLQRFGVTTEKFGTSNAIMSELL
jgi:Protein of unknown function (DUF1552)